MHSHPLFIVHRFKCHGDTGRRARNCRAFSLVELSVALVILGLLVGGVLTAQNLIRAAELRNVYTEYEAYMKAVKTFKDQYQSYPGDMHNATNIWGSLGGTGSDLACQAIEATDSATCNGNGDGWIDTSVVTYDERFRAIQHLANAKLIEGTYTGRDGAATQGDTSSATYFKMGVNLPRSRIPGALNGFASLPTVASGHPNFFDGIGGRNVFYLIGFPEYPIFTPREMLAIDRKIDDGAPSSGNVWVSKPGGTWMPDCATSDNRFNAAYDVDYKEKACYFYGYIQ